MEWLLPLALLLFPFGSALLVMLGETIILRRRLGPGFTMLLLRTETLEVEPARLTLARGAATLSADLPTSLARRWAAALLQHGASYARRARPRMCWLIAGVSCPDEVDTLLRSWRGDNVKALLFRGLLWFDVRGHVAWRLSLSEPVRDTTVQIGQYVADSGCVLWNTTTGEVFVRSLVYGDLRFPDLSQFLVFVYWWDILRSAYPHLDRA